MPTIKLTDAAVQRLKAPPGGPRGLLRCSDSRARLASHGRSRSAAGATHVDAVLSDRRPAATADIRAGLSRSIARRSPCCGDAGPIADQSRRSIRPKPRRRPRKEPARAPDTVGNVVEAFIRLDLERRKRAPRYIADVRKIFTNHVLPRWADRDIRSDHPARCDRAARRDYGCRQRCQRRQRQAAKAARRAGDREQDAGGRPRDVQLGASTRDDRGDSRCDGRGAWRGNSACTSSGRQRDRCCLDRGQCTFGYPFGPFFQLALVPRTTARRGRGTCSGVRWIWRRRTWTLPTSKSGRAHVVPLAPWRSIF